MEKLINIEKYILYLDKSNNVYNNQITFDDEGSIRLYDYLYIIQMVYYAKYNKKLFNEKININNYMNIKDTYNFKNLENKKFIEKIFNALKYAPLNDLNKIVSDSKKEDYKEKCLDFISLLD